jgi:uncharacterized membrane protein
MVLGNFMAASTLTPPMESPVRRGTSDILIFLCWLGLAVGILARIFAGISAPLWFDETFSAVIATQEDVRLLVRWMLTELSGPTYYTMLFLWEKLAGDSNFALRLPSLLISIATPLLILWKGHSDRAVRMVWMALMALSGIAVETATQARPYSLMLILGTAQAIAFLRLMDNVTQRNAFVWTSISALAVLTHYHAAILCGIQGAAFLAVNRFKAARTWPALLPLLPMAAWMALHLPFIASFAQKDVAWYNLLDWKVVWLVPSLITGWAWPGVVLLLTMFASMIFDVIHAARQDREWPYSTGETALFGSSLTAMILVIGVGFMVPSFTPRYMLPFLPGLVAGIAFWINRLKARSVIVAVPILCIMTGATIGVLEKNIVKPEDDFRYSFTFQSPSDWIAAHGATRLVMLWDNPTAALNDPDGHLGAVGSYFLRRSGHSISTIVPAWPRSGDPNITLLDAAGNRRDTAILWAYDTDVPGTRGAIHPWKIPQLNPSWHCRDFGKPPIVVLACINR